MADFAIAAAQCDWLAQVFLHDEPVADPNICAKVEPVKLVDHCHAVADRTQ